MIVYELPETCYREHGRAGKPEAWSATELVDSFHHYTKFTEATFREQIFKTERFGISDHAKDLNLRNWKNYPENRRVSLPEPQISPLPLSTALRRRASNRNFSGKPITLQCLSNILRPAICRSRKSRERGKSHLVAHYAPYPSAGALYPIEHYCVLLNVDGVPADIAYVDPIKQELVLLEREISPARLQDAFTIMPEWIGATSLIIVQTAILERNTVKYGARGYRHALIESGHAAQNILLLAANSNLKATPVAGFFEDRVSLLLGVDGDNEIIVGSVFVGR